MSRPAPPSDVRNSASRPSDGPRSADRRRRTALAAGLALALAFAGQAALTPPWEDGGSVGLGVALYLAAIISILVAAPGAGRAECAPGRTPDAGEPSLVPGRLRRTVGLALWPVGLAALTLSVWAVAAHRPQAGIALWLGALLLTSLATGLASGFPVPLPRSRSAWAEIAAVLLCVAVGFALRYVELDHVPHEVHGDEAAVGIAARDLLANRWGNLFELGWSSQPETAFAAHALALRYLGDDLHGLRLASVIQGSLAIGLLYGVARRLFARRVALLGAAFLATGQMAIHYSRIGNNYIGALFASLLFLWLLLEAIRSGSALLFLLAGFAGGLTLSVYIAARLTVVVAALYLLRRALIEPDFLRTHWRGFLLTCAGAVLFLAPQGVVYSHGLGRIFDRTSGVFVLRADNLKHQLGAYQVRTTREVLVRQAENTIAAFNLTGETSDQYDQRAPLLDFWSSALFVLGAALVTWSWRDPRHLLLAAWLWLTLLLGSVLTVDALFSPHLVPTLGVLALLPALALDVGWRSLVAQFGANGRKVAAAAGACLLLLSGHANAVGVFVVHDRAMAPRFFTVLARYIGAVNARYRVYLVTDAETSLEYDTVRFLDPALDGVDVRDHPLDLPLDSIPARKGVAFVFRDPHDPRLAAARRAYPGGIESVQRSTNDVAQFVTYTVAHHDLLAANPHALQEARKPPATDGRPDR